MDSKTYFFNNYTNIIYNLAMRYGNEITKL